MKQWIVIALLGLILLAVAGGLAALWVIEWEPRVNADLHATQTREQLWNDIEWPTIAPPD